MPELIYRVVSACGALGYGFPDASLQQACEGRVDAIISDAGSMDAGPYYLGTGTEYFEREAVKSDFTSMVRAAQQKDCPLVLGSSGMAGGDRNLAWMIDVAKEVFAEQGVEDWPVAVINAEIEPQLVVDELTAGRLPALGAMPAPTEQAVRESVVVGQMGIHPLITALEEGARAVLAGRACDIALFASDMIRRGIDPGLAYHVGHVLECGALACDPGSPSDCLVAEVYDDGTAVFVAPNPDRACRPYSVAAHSLYEESHPELQFYPEGVLCLSGAEFFPVGDDRAGVRGPVFAHTDHLTIKLEGSRRVGARRVSLLPFDAADLDKVPADHLVYGRNGVEPQPVSLPGEREIGIVIETRAERSSDAETLASLLTHYLIHYGYPGRKATAGNVAYPLSPNLVSFTRDDGSAGAMVVQGTRDPVFQENYASIEKAVLDLIAAQFPDALRRATYTITVLDAEHPGLLVRTVDADPDQVEARHEADLDVVREFVTPGPDALTNLPAPDLYEWTLFHLYGDRGVIENRLFPIRFYTAAGADWTFDREVRARYFDVGVKDYDGDLDERTLATIPATEPAGEPLTYRPLREMAKVIRTKDAGVDRLTYDILFNDEHDYRAALRSGVFARDRITAMLPVPAEHVVGTYQVPASLAIKISIDRPIISASADERDVFGAQQQAEFILMSLPIYPDPLQAPTHNGVL
ncbi:DUF4387 family protein [Actinomycetospora sp. C-140]